MSSRKRLIWLQEESHAATYTDALSSGILNIFVSLETHSSHKSDKQRRDFIMSCRHVTFFKDITQDNCPLRSICAQIRLRRTRKSIIHGATEKDNEVFRLRKDKQAPQ
ncbi:hypothetical protein CDAR_222341 [Caerostris darwini]|uniref:Uncharacterized protein n=1 Tax=Caerostris darwini TaxID=1538125 RepID=A0AAV4SX29_9ARAC|nr:hypothetical protein CDAR_222341 [Caerostris darwini]